MRRLPIIILPVLMLAACSDAETADTAAAAAGEPSTTAAATTTTVAVVPAGATSTTTSTAPASTTSTTSTSTTTTTTSTTTTTTAAPAGPGSPPSAEITQPEIIGGPLKLEAAFDSELTDFVAATTLGASVSDPDGDIASIEWFTNGDPLGTGQTLDVRLSASAQGSDVAVHTITLRVTDWAGNVTEQQVQLIVWIPSDE